jgi:hypothetical protein
MSKKLRVTIDSDLNNDGHDDVHVTPVDVSVPNDVAGPIEKIIDLADLQDAEPGDGNFDYIETIRFDLPIGPFKFKVSKKVKVTVSLE